MIKKNPLKRFQSMQESQGFINRNYSQLVLIFVAIIPTILMVSSTFTTLWYLQSQSIIIIKQFADGLYQDQINSSKLSNAALVFQINQEIQKIAWQMNMLNEFSGKIIQGNVMKNLNHIPALHNIDRTYTNTENPTILAMFQRNPILTSVWHQVSKDYLSQLDSTETQQISDAIRLDSIWKSIMNDNNNIEKQHRWLKIKTMYMGHTYDGMLYMFSQNSTYSTYQIPDGCPYVGPFRLDVRCRFYYQPTIDNMSTVVFAPSVQYGGGLTYIASIFCERRLKYAQANNPDSDSSIYSFLCITLDLSVIPQYFSNFGRNSKFQMFLDPRSYTVIYDSINPLQVGQITNVQQQETSYLQDQAQAAIFLQNIGQNSQLIESGVDSINLDVTNAFSQNQKTFEYIRNGTDCFVIMNTVKMIDKVPSFEHLKTANPANKFQLKNVFLFLDVLSKEKMLQYSKNLENTIRYYNRIFTYASWGIIILLFGFQFYYSALLGSRTLEPVIHLTRILKQIRISQAKTPMNVPRRSFRTSQDQQSNQNLQNNFISEMSIDLDNQIQIDEQIDQDLKGVCFSSDTQILLDSFQNLFKILRFTTQNFYQENESISLLNLNIQIQHFSSFGNYRALGVCHNNMGVIHYNSGRYQEAIENFQKAIIYAKYELNIYSHEGDGTDFSNNVKRHTVNLRSSLLSRSTTLEGAGEQQPNNQQLEQSSFQSEQARVASYNNFLSGNNNNNEKQLLYWNLFNRNENYLKTLTLYLKDVAINLWDLFQDAAIENMSISQLFLPPSNKREMINYYTILLSYYHLNESEDQHAILDKYSQLYLKNYEVKQNNVYQNQTKITDSPDQIGLLINQISQFASPTSNSAGREIYNSILLSPMNKKYKRNNQKGMQNKLHLDQIEESILISKSPKNNGSQQNDDSQNIQPQFYQNEIKLNKQQNSSMSAFRRESLLTNNLNMSKFLDYKQPQQQQQQQQFQESEIKLVRRIQDQSPTMQNSPYIYSDKKMKISNMSTLQFTNKNIPQFCKINYRDNNDIANQNIEEENNVRLSSPSTSSKIQRVLNSLKLKYHNHNQPVKQQVQSSDRYNAQTNKASSRQSKRVPNSKNKQQKVLIFYRVRKIQNSSKISQYEFSSDIYFAYYALQQAKFQIKQRNFLSAAEILTNVLEQCKYYLPHLKIQILKLLCNIFKAQKIQSIDLQGMKRKYKSASICNQHVCLISVCNSSQSKKRIFALSNDLVNEVLFKQQDSFGILSYIFDENIYSQLMGYTSTKTIHSNPSFFEQIFYSLLNKKQIQKQPTNITTTELKNEYENKQQGNKLIFSPLSIKRQSDTQIALKESNQLRESFYSRDIINQKDISLLKDISGFNSNANLKSVNQLEFGTKYNKAALNFTNINTLQNKDFNRLSMDNRKNSLRSQSQFMQVRMLKQDNEEQSDSSSSQNSSQEEVLFSRSPSLKKKGTLEISQNFNPFSSKQDTSIQQQQFSQKQLITQQNRQTNKNTFPNEFNNDDVFDESVSTSNNYQQMYWSSKKAKKFLGQYNLQDLESPTPETNFQFDNFNLHDQNKIRYLSEEKSPICNYTQSDNQQILGQLKLIENSPDISKSPQLAFTKVSLTKIQLNENNNNNNNNKIVDNKNQSPSKMTNFTLNGIKLTSMNSTMKGVSTTNEGRFYEEQPSIANFKFSSEADTLNHISHPKANNSPSIQNIVSQKQIIPFQFQELSDSGNHPNNNNSQKTDNFETLQYINDKRILNNVYSFGSQQKFSSENGKMFTYKHVYETDQTNNKILFSPQFNPQEVVPIFQYPSLDPSNEGQQLNNQRLDYDDNNLLKQQRRNNGEEVEIQQQQQQQIQKKNDAQKNSKQQAMIETKISEQVFHLGIHAALKQFILNSNNKITTYLSRKKQKESGEQQHLQGRSINHPTNQSYMIYCTDQQLEFNKTSLLKDLSELLLNLDVELLILMINEKQTLEEFSDLNNVVIKGRSVISFFNTEEKLLQYLYNYREHIKNYLIPMMVEHF